MISFIEFLVEGRLVRDLGILDVESGEYIETSGSHHSGITFHQEMVRRNADKFVYDYHDRRFPGRYVTYRVVGESASEYDVYFVVGSNVLGSLADLYEHCVRGLMEEECIVHLHIGICDVTEGGQCDLDYDFELPRDIKKFWKIARGQ